MIRNVENMRSGVCLTAVCVYLGGLWCSYRPSKYLLDGKMYINLVPWGVKTIIVPLKYLFDSKYT